MTSSAKNRLIKSVTDDFIPRHIKNGLILEADEESIAPGLIIHDRKRDWLFLVDACHNSPPIDDRRRIELASAFAKSGKHLVMFSAFSVQESFSESAESIAWGTHVWIADTPDHMIHFNGERFLGPYDENHHHVKTP